MKRNEILENLVYAGLWLMLLLTPVISLLIRMSADSTIQFSWDEVLDSWRMLLPFILLFVLHNFVMARLLIYNHKVWLYIGLTAAMLVIFQLYECQHRPRPHDEGERPDWMAKPAPGMQPERPAQPNGDIAMQEPPRRMPDDIGDRQGPPPPLRDMQEGRPENGKGGPPHMSLNGPVMPMLCLLLMLGLNLGIKYYFKSRMEAKKMEALQRVHLEQQLEYLKYQVNPHFFMNTLNNIHALVDIDPEQAKDTIVELSKLMRYVLYEGAKDKVSLLREVDFLKHYVALMRLRYTEHVKIDIEIADDLPERLVPPMILITFVENAFKHGVSYRNPSFIDIRIYYNEGRLYFSCSNSVQESTHVESGGVGLRNVQERLHLLFGNDYTLLTDEGADRYEVHLDFPTYEKQPNT